MIARNATIPFVIAVITMAPIAIASTVAKGETLVGETGASSRWKSGWLDLASPTDFERGDRLRLMVGGTASRILVRLLPQGGDPGTTVGIVGGAVAIPENRVVEIILEEDRKRVVQISVHGGPNPWGQFPLGADNGSATLLSAQRVTAPAGESERESSELQIETLLGKTGASSRWKSGWLDLASPTDFERGDRLRLMVGGTASRILVRLLPQGGDPGTTVGIVGGAVAIPENRVVEIVLEEDRKRVVQISVHGGPNPWGQFPLGADNGPATLVGAARAKTSARGAPVGKP